MAIDYQKIQPLIADGDRQLRNIIRDLLIGLGIPRSNIRDCATGADAIELLTIRRSDFLVAELRMSPMDGLTLLRRLRNPDVTPAPGIPVILYSDTLDEDMLTELRGAGVNEVLVKPINGVAIRSRVAAVLERPRALVNRPDYIGPERRRNKGPWDGVERRSRKDDYFIC
jgi:CheY-like chemotaxis protein